MKAFFEGIQWLFENVMFLPHNFFRKLELSSWFGANIINWILFIICMVAMVYWCKQIKLHVADGDEDQDTTAHSFLK